MLTLFIKRGGRLERREITPVRFVPLIGAQGWPS
jgi:protein-L-isoaspartate(D-aspartate) O-methyltransferase